MELLRGGEIIFDETEQHFASDGTRNFPVPLESDLPTSNIPAEIYLGFIEEMITVFANEVDVSEKAFNLCFDLVRINPNQVHELGNVDLCGHEDSPTKSEITERLSKETLMIKAALDMVSAQLGILRDKDVSHLSANQKVKLIQHFQDIIRLLTLRLKDLRT